MVSDAFIFNDDIENVIKRIKPNIVVKGKEHENNINPETNICYTIDNVNFISSEEEVILNYSEK